MFPIGNVPLNIAWRMGGIPDREIILQENADLIYDFGLNLGLAFQLQDDYLDAFGNPETFGKQVGGDIIENKKTYLFVKSCILEWRKKKQLKSKSQVVVFLVWELNPPFRTQDDYNIKD